MRVRVVWVGKRAERWADEAVDDYKKRLRRGGKVEERQLKPETFRGDIESVRQAEGERVLASTKERDLLVACDERGEAPSTEQFASLVRDAMAQGTPWLTFAIGGPYGHSPEVRRRAWRVVRLSPMVLNHQIARVVLWEQLYRAYTLEAGIPYHH